MYLYYKILLNNIYLTAENELKNDVDIFSNLSTLELLDELLKGYFYIKNITDIYEEHNGDPSVNKIFDYNKYKKLKNSYERFFNALDTNLQVYLTSIGYDGFNED